MNAPLTRGKNLIDKQMMQRAPGTRQLRSSESQRLKRCYCTRGHVDILPVIRSCWKLQRLMLCRFDVIPSVVEALATLKQLTSLSLEGSRLNDARVRALALSVPHLRHLSIAYNIDVTITGTCPATAQRTREDHLGFQKKIASAAVKSTEIR